MGAVTDEPFDPVEPSRPRPDGVGEAIALPRSDWDRWQMNAFLNYVLLRILRVDTASARAADVTDRQHKALLFIRGAPVVEEEGWVPLPVLRRYLLADKATAGQLIERLRRKELVEVRRPHPTGPVDVRLTTLGERTLEEVSARNQDALRDLIGEIGAENVPLVLEYVWQYLQADQAGVERDAGQE